MAEPSFLGPSVKIVVDFAHYIMVIPKTVHHVAEGKWSARINDWINDWINDSQGPQLQINDWGPLCCLTTPLEKILKIWGHLFTRVQEALGQRSRTSVEICTWTLAQLPRKAEVFFCERLFGRFRGGVVHREAGGRK